MKLVQNLPEIFEEFGEKKREAFLEIKEYKDKGIPVVGILRLFSDRTCDGGGSNSGRTLFFF